MANIRLDLDSPVTHGQSLIFRSPVDCSQVTGLIVYYIENTEQVSRTFQFADSHGNNVESADLFASDVLVKVILDTELNRAYVQNADTNKYIEETFLKRSGGEILGDLIVDGSLILVRGKNYGTEAEIPEDLPDGALWLKVVE